MGLALRMISFEAVSFEACFYVVSNMLVNEESVKGAQA
jgi:hypothetical protein